MLIVITGNGKGKTTSALGMTVRAMGHDKKCAVVQFIKSESQNCGEYIFLNRNGVEWKNFGCGFTWQQNSLKETSDLCRKGWEEFKSMVKSGNYYLIVLDEFTYAIEENAVEKEEVLSFLKGNNIIGSENIHVVITGRRACSEIMEAADTVSEINEVKHHFNSNGKKCLCGLEY